MQAAARKRDKYVALADKFRAVDLVLFGDTHGKACKVEVAFLIHRGLKKGQKPLPDVLYIENKKNKSDDRKGKFPVIKNCESCTNYIYQDEPLNLFDKMDEIKELAPDFLRLDFSFETETEVREVMKFAKFSK